MEHDIAVNISSQHCSHCGGEVDGWKCPTCGHSTRAFDPFHRKSCRNGGGKLKLKCKTCGESEDHCGCTPKQKI